MYMHSCSNGDLIWTGLVRLGMQPPDPTLQHRTLKSMVARMASKHSDFQYRLHAFQMNAGMFGMVTQEQVQDLWKYLSADALEFQGGQPKKRTRSTKK